MQIDCERCPNRKGDRPCEECLVTFILDLDEDTVVESEGAGDGPLLVDAAEARAIHALSESGLIPPLRVRPHEEAG